MTTDNDLAIEVRGLAKRFGDVEAVAGIDFDVREGELFGFLGPNGAGKSTTINILIGLARSDAGTIRIGGIDCSTNPKAAQHLMGVVPDESNLRSIQNYVANSSTGEVIYTPPSAVEVPIMMSDMVKWLGKLFIGYPQGCFVFVAKVCFSECYSFHSGLSRLPPIIHNIYYATRLDLPLRRGTCPFSKFQCPTNRLAGWYLKFSRFRRSVHILATR